MKDTMIAAITVLFVLCLMLAWEISSSWQRNDRLFNLNVEQYMTIVHLNERIDTLKREQVDRQNICDRVSK